MTVFALDPKFPKSTAKKVKRWIERVEEDNLAMFPSTEEYSDSTDIMDNISYHLRKSPLMNLISGAVITNGSSSHSVIMQE